MKTKLQVRQVSQVLALFLAITLSFTACGGTPTSNNSGNSNPTSDTSSSSSSTSSNDSGNSSNSNSQTQSSTNSTASTIVNTSAKAKGVFAADPYSDMPSAVKKKELHVLMWREYTKTEQSLIAAYQKKTNVKIRTTVTTEEQLPTKLVSLISGGDPPDVVCISSNNFPSFVINSLQPLDTQTFRLNDSIWSKTYMDSYKVNGKYFGVAISGTWNCEDAAYVTYYNKQVLSNCGITTTPYQLYQQGKWNWDTQYQIASQVYNKNKSYTGLSLQSYDLFMLSAGVDFITYNGKQFTNTMKTIKSGDLLVKSWAEMSKMREDGVASNWNLQNVNNNKVGLFSAIAYGFYKDGGWYDSMKGGTQNLEAVPMAGPKDGTAYTPIRPKTWGIAKGADNADGAAYFLRFFLDPTNMNMSSTFYNKQFETVFNIVKSKNNKKMVRISSGVINFVSTGSYDTLINTLATTTSANITSVINQKKPVIDTGVKRANSQISKIK